MSPTTHLLSPPSSDTIPMNKHATIHHNTADVNAPSLYNDKNKLASELDVNRLLQRFASDLRCNDINVFRRAFVNRSYCTRRNENYVDGNTRCPANCLPLQEESNERLEFFGDSILATVVTEYLFRRYPKQNEGFLSNMRTKIVNGAKLAELSKHIGLDEYVIVSAQLEESGGRGNKNVLEDTLEAFIGAIFLDGEHKGYDEAREWIVGMMETLLDFSELVQTNTNYKDKLVKHCQYNLMYSPKFVEVDRREQHQSKNAKRTHTVVVKDNAGNTISSASNTCRKNAEMDAARQALAYYGVN